MFPCIIMSFFEIVHSLHKNKNLIRSCHFPSIIMLLVGLVKIYGNHTSGSLWLPTQLLQLSVQDLLFALRIGKTKVTSLSHASEINIAMDVAFDITYWTQQFFVFHPKVIPPNHKNYHVKVGLM